jgi:hypothetical protein
VSYRVEITDRSDAEIQEAFLWLNARNPEFSGRWLEGLLRAIGGLEEFPTIHRVTEDSTFAAPIRELLYKSGRVVYRVLFTLMDADEDDVEGVVKVLSVRHGARKR